MKQIVIAFLVACLLMLSIGYILGATAPADSPAQAAGQLAVSAWQGSAPLRQRLATLPATIPWRIIAWEIIIVVPLLALVALVGAWYQEHYVWPVDKRKSKHAR